MDTAVPAVTTWLNEGLKHYSAGDPARALEAWYRILEVEPQHAAALEYVAFVRETVRVDAPPAATATPPEAHTPGSPPPPAHPHMIIYAHPPTHPSNHL